MKRFLWIFALMVSPAASADSAAEVKCVDAKADARFRSHAYSHVVVLTNNCEHAVSCTVTTDVNPAPTKANVPAGETKEVLTFMSSPSRVFKPSVSCVKAS